MIIDNDDDEDDDSDDDDDDDDAVIIDGVSRSCEGMTQQILWALL